MASINPGDEQRVEAIKESLRATVRFPAMVNAGGAIATVSILGATANEGDLINILALPLALFLLGLFVTLLGAANLGFAIAQNKDGSAEPIERGYNWLRKAIGKHPESLHFIPIVLFSLGCISGLIIIACS